jgi:SAM-dependent methyltransferase
MRISRRLFGSCLLLAACCVTPAPAQSTEARRKPDVPFVPTTDDAVQAMLKLADVKATDTVYDLGCGDGRIVIAAAKNFGARAVGIDIDPQRIKEANENAKKAGVEKRVKFIEQDLFKADFHEATVVTLFLLPQVNLQLKPVLMKQLKPGTRIVSNTFDMGDWKAEKEFNVGGDNGDDDAFLSRHLFLWTVPKGDSK